MTGKLDALLDEVRLLWNVLLRTAERLHGQEFVTVGMRAVLEALQLGGSATVPQLARRRRVTRQHIQTLVNALAKAGLVQSRPNPDHKRSVLIALTPQGAKTIQRMKAKERRLLSKIPAKQREMNLPAAIETLRAVRRRLESKELR